MSYQRKKNNSMVLSQFRFDVAFDEMATNELVYKYTARPLVQEPDLIYLSIHLSIQTIQLSVSIYLSIVYKYTTRPQVQGFKIQYNALKQTGLFDLENKTFIELINTPMRRRCCCCCSPGSSHCHPRPQLLRLGRDPEARPLLGDPPGGSQSSVGFDWQIIPTNVQTRGGQQMFKVLELDP